MWRIMNVWKCRLYHGKAKRQAETIKEQKENENCKEQRREKNKSYKKKNKNKKRNTERNDVKKLTMHIKKNNELINNELMRLISSLNNNATSCMTLVHTYMCYWSICVVQNM